MRTKILLFISFIPFFGNTQTNQKISIDELVSNFIKELQNQKIDNICVYEDYCIGCRETSDSILCKSKEFGLQDYPSYPVYIFWKEKGETYLNKISICFEFSKLNISKHAFWDIYFSNEKIIKNEVIKNYEYEIIENSKKVKYTAFVDHGGFQNFKFIINGRIIEKKIDSFNFIKKDDYFPPNMNYDHNIKLKTKLLIDIFENITSEAEINNKFKKIKSR
jgi:hypothetical protein